MAKSRANDELTVLIAYKLFVYTSSVVKINDALLRQIEIQLFFFAVEI